MRRLWRISNYADLSGTGGLRFHARWHTMGSLIVYCADHPAAALAEYLVHLDPEDFTEAFNLLTIEIESPDDVDSVDHGSLPESWITDHKLTQEIGNKWLKARSSLILQVPSALLPDVQNYILNPAHPGIGRAKITKSRHVKLDPRFITLKSKIDP